MPPHEQMRAWVENWKRIGPELEETKKRELRAMTEEEAGEKAAVINESAADDIWVRPAKARSEGFIEQQRLFQKCHPRI